MLTDIRIDSHQFAHIPIGVSGDGYAKNWLTAGDLLNRKYRLTRTEDFKRVRRTGKSYAHPLLILVASANGQETTRVGIVAGKAVGGAVQRNRAKRLLREVFRNHLPQLVPGWDLVLIARQPMAAASYNQVAGTVMQLLARAKLLSGEQTLG